MFTFMGPDDLINVQAPKEATVEETQLVNTINLVSNDMR